MTLYCWHVDIAACSYGLTLVQSSGQGSPAINTWHGVIICVNYATASWKVQCIASWKRAFLLQRFIQVTIFFAFELQNRQFICNCCKALLWQPLKNPAWKIENIIVFFLSCIFFPKFFLQQMFQSKLPYRVYLNQVHLR